MWHPNSSILQGNGDNEKTMYGMKKKMYGMDSDTERNSLLKWVYFYQDHYFSQTIYWLCLFWSTYTESCPLGHAGVIYKLLQPGE